ncbi:hypothetical protein HG530_007008 [Fusarium avenaceum]|nr:hypothetical protein HG530_007008 [Fusarium avenaceum]
MLGNPSADALQWETLQIGRPTLLTGFPTKRLDFLEDVHIYTRREIHLSTFTPNRAPSRSGPATLPPPTTFHGGCDIRVNECGQCYRREFGSGLGVLVPGGCWDFTSCNRGRTICVNPGKLRAHRIWKDNGDKKCYATKVENLGSCGPVKKRVVLHHNADLPCNW